MKKKVLVAMMATTLLLAGCSSNTTNSEVKDEPTRVRSLLAKLRLRTMLSLQILFQTLKIYLLMDRCL